MTAHLPTTESARARLRDAQKAEATALREVEAASRVQRRAHRRLDEADIALQTARHELVRVSGIDRAALLLDLPVEQVRSSSKVQRRRQAHRPGVAEDRANESSKDAAP